ncbi:hypothetical protein [Streptomyces albireticuli]|uniref:hypothetical protein n=1 Tax=Streptomyces albireticuli TaxID=1940 RepID=UPI0023EC6AD7|nr:hypothetical protein [Streptomyces albireticuli]
MGVFGSERRTGKPDMDDLREGKHPLLLALAYQRAAPGSTPSSTDTSATRSSTRTAPSAYGKRSRLLAVGPQANTNRPYEPGAACPQDPSGRAALVRKCLTDLATSITVKTS